MQIQFLLLILAGLLSACASHHQQQTEPTQLEIREFQTRTFDVKSHQEVMKSILDVLQDDGYMVKNVDANLGFLSAVKETECYGINQPRFEHMSEFDVGFGLSMGGGGFGMNQRFPPSRRAPARPAHECIEATVNVSQFGESVRVRASFQQKIYDTNESVIRIHKITDPEFYQNFFIKVDKGIFIQTQSI